MRAVTKGMVVGAALVAALTAAPAEAQTLDRAVAAVDDGTVVFTFPTRDDVYVCDRGIRMGSEEGHATWTGRGDGSWNRNCRRGPATVELRVRDGRVRGVDVLDREEARGVRASLGEVPAPEAVAFLAGVARTGDGDAGEDAVFPMVLADVPRVWEELLTLAEDRGLPSDTRRSALFWVGQAAAETATAGLARVAADEREDQDVRDAAVFALSQRPGEEGLPALMELARTAREAETRRTALFWLAQSDRPEVVEFFADILRGG